jgi:hypothetical protein
MNMLILIIVGILFLVVIGLIVANYVRDILASLDENRLRVYILTRSDFLKRYYCKKITVAKAEVVSIGKVDYEVPKKPFRMGMFRVPTVFYEEGKKKPLSLRSDSTLIEKHDGADLATVRRHNLITQLLASFKPAMITQEMAVVIIIGAVALGAIGTWYMINQELTLIKNLLLAAQS